MKVLLVYNAGAGAGISPDALIRDLQSEGVNVAEVCESLPDQEAAQRAKVDLVVVAGGDGTVSRSAIAMRNRDLPLAIMPMGTANNIAKTLGLMRPIGELCSLWKGPPGTTMDLGVVRNGAITERFAEGVGVGLIADTIATVDADAKRFQTHEQILAAYDMLLDRALPQTVSVVVDDEPAETMEVLLLEALNIASVGSNILLNGQARPDDGYLDVVFALEDDRAQLKDYFRALRSRGSFELKLPNRRARRVAIHNIAQVHIDDQVRSVPTGNVEVEIEPAALRVFA